MGGVTAFDPLSLVDLVRAYGGLASDVVLQRIRTYGLPDLDGVTSDMKGRNCVVTGATTGIGLHTARALARAGANVFLFVRSPTRAAAALEQCRRDADAAGHKSSDIEIVLVDVADMESIRVCARRWAEGGRPIHTLISNAGVFDMGALSRSLTKDGFELHLGTNHLGPYLLTALFLPWIKAAAASSPGYVPRIVLVASFMHWAGYLHRDDMHMDKSFSGPAAYGQSKLASVMFAALLRARLPSSWGVECVSLNPGNIASDVTRTLPQPIQWIHKNLLFSMLFNTAEGARANVWCATSPDAPVMAKGTIGYFDQRCRLAPASPRAADVAAQEWLWDWSAEQVQLRETVATMDWPEDVKAEVLSVFAPDGAVGEGAGGRGRSAVCNRGIGGRGGAAGTKSPARSLSRSRAGKRG